MSSQIITPTNRHYFTLKFPINTYNNYSTFFHDTTLSNVVKFLTSSTVPFRYF